MAERSLPQIPPASAAGPTGLDPAVPLVQLDALLEELEREVPRQEVSPPVLGPDVDNRLVQVRLGIASSLYAALRFRYAATASHSLRVALSCSTWAAWMGLEAKARDVIEVAALLHDVGVIGVPDQVLFKPGPLDADEHMVFEQSRRMSVEILRSACAEQAVLEIVENVGAWYDGSRGGFRYSGDRIPLGARMIAIVEAFDAMTCDQVFRSAIPEERAAQELFGWAGRQFDPALVRDFAEFSASDPAQLRREAARRWLHTLDPEAANSFWELGAPPPLVPRNESGRAFEHRLLDNMHDAVVFIDTALRIVQWNHGAERLTGISASSIVQRTWSPSVLNMQNEKGQWIAESDCPVVCVMHSGTQSLRRLTISGRGGRPVAVDSHAIPVPAADGTPLGVVLLLHDASSETSLEERCQSLHEKATKDPLTQVANRAEFDRVLEMFVNAHRQQQVPCALVICDLDHFKQVNDTFGHQAGDEAIKSLAALLRNSCRPGDLVARYGGEEFVLLCADCNNAAAARRAEQVRRRLGRLAQPRLDGRVVTASFGVTEIQPGDTPETMLRRADRALLMAKEKGRNRVVQLGVGSEDDQRKGRLSGWWQKEEAPPLVLQQNLVTPVPLAMAIEKLRGFVADHQAQIVKIDGSDIQLQVNELPAAPLRRVSDRPVGFVIELHLDEQRLANPERYGDAAVFVSRTRVSVSVRPQKGRDRRRADVADRARELLASFRSYLIATCEDAAPAEGVFRRASRILTPWLLKR